MFDDMTKNVLLIYKFALKRIYPEKYREILELMIKYMESRKNNRKENLNTFEELNFFSK